jgi:hypothetical protein
MAAIKASCSIVPASSFASSSRQLASSRPLRASGSRRVLRAAASKLPAGVTAPPRQPQVPPPMFGWVDNAERLNSRAAMIGFFSLLLLEAVANKGLLDLIGFQTGKGLGFEI